AIKDFCFEKLHNIYSEIPHTRCKCCGKCCKNMATRGLLTFANAGSSLRSTVIIELPTIPL
ncbi:MAG: hypothetical protein SWO11_04800, partial [Thermodesulfobacteriota bacterium]|nr:hypothetical protein [Thermodesulfobacteriota bacterium]